MFIEILLYNFLEIGMQVCANLHILVVSFSQVLSDSKISNCVKLHHPP